MTMLEHATTPEFNEMEKKETEIMHLHLCQWITEN